MYLLLLFFTSLEVNVPTTKDAAKNAITPTPYQSSDTIQTC